MKITIQTRKRTNQPKDEAEPESHTQIVYDSLKLKKRVGRETETE